jgi:hypothetical protein
VAATNNTNQTNEADSTIEIGLEKPPFVVLVYFFLSFEHAKNLLTMGPNNTKNSSLKSDFLIFNYEIYCQNIVFIVKKT